MMAENLDLGDISKHSPRESFNPLDDPDDAITASYLTKASNHDKSEEEESDNCDENVDDVCPNSEEEDDEGNVLQYGTTPPAPRLHKRLKAKSLGRSYKTMLNEKRQQQPKTAVNVIKREFQGDPALCDLRDLDSDDNLDGNKDRQDRRRKESKKTLTRIRRSDQTEKRLSEDFSNISVSDGLGLSHVTGMKLEGSGRFNRLHPQIRPSLSLGPDFRPRRQILEPPHCPSNRVKFYQEFSILISLGTEAKKREERSSYKRQISVEQEQRRSNLSEQIWIELRGYLNNGISAEEQAECMLRERQTHDFVIDEINHFSFAELVAQECPDSAFIKDPSTVNLFFKPIDESFKEHVSRSVSASFSDVNLTDETVCLQEKALIHVQKLLEKLDKCERSYNTTKAFCRANEKYKDPVFQRRVKCLNLWLNITCDLCQKLKLFGRIIGIHSRNSNWPLLNFEFPQAQPKEFLASPRPSIPNITQPYTSDNNDEEEEEEEEDISEGKKDACSKSEGEVPEGEKQDTNTPLHKQVTFVCGGEDDQSVPTTPVVVEPILPMDASTPIRGGSHSNFPSAGSLISALSMSRASSEISLDEMQPKPSLYRHYAEKCLRKMGLHRLNLRLRKLFHDSLDRAKEALARPRESFYTDSNMDTMQSEQDQDNGAENASSEHIISSESSPRPSFHRGSSLSEHGEWSQLFIEMGLPSFRPTYLFVARIHVDVIHECLKIRKEQRPKDYPSFLSIRQLIRECKEVLKSATLVKQYYQFMVNAVIWDEQEAENKMAMDLTDFDDDLKSMLDVYFNYLQSWIYMLQSLPEASLGMKSALEEEWAFTKSICAYVINGEAEAGKKFSSLASSLLSSIGDFLDNGIDANTQSLYDDEEDEEEEGENYDGEDGQGFDDQGDKNDSNESESYKPGRKSKQNIQNVLKSFKNLFNEARERASKALGFTKLLRKDLEIAADFNISVPTQELLEELAKTQHIQVLAPLNSRYMMFIPKHIISNKVLILQLLNVTSGQEEVVDPSGKEEGYLLMLRCDTENHVWSGDVVRVEPTAETAIALSHIEVMGLLFVVTHSSTLTQGREYFEKIMGRTVQVVNEQTSCHQSIAESLSELKTNALDLMVKVSQSIKQVNDGLNGSEIIQQDEHILKLYRETMLKIYDFGFEYQKELMRLISHDQKEKQCQMIVAFAKDWMDFVKNKCETGRGIRPRWATQGLEFVSLACEPKNVVYLNDQEFSDFQTLIRQCLTHIIGSLHSRPVGAGIGQVVYHHRHSELNRSVHQPPMHRLTSCPENRFYRSISSRSVESEPANVGHHGHSNSSSIVSTPSSPGSAFFNDTPIKMPRSDRLRDSIQKLERGRETMLRDKRVIGKLSQHIQEADYRMIIKRVKFRWQRGIKIGTGNFGKVYTAVNINTGELMAMKEMSFQPNDHMFFKETCDEIKNFEGINHKNLVKYYGMEVHKEEMLIFMEYCDSGSIEEVARLGLPEYMIRRYTLEITKAVAHLHENNLIHRDIKGANIFLTSQGHVKLGDFGCSVKLKSQHTMPGENVSLVGTTAYMAPEVVTQTEQAGHGRAADIWSLGCVVLEMFTGKRPWHELEHNIQVMFKVGTGHLPTIPDSITKEGKLFINDCLVHDPFDRMTAQDLLDHIFVKYYDEKDGNDGDDLDDK